MRIGIISDTHGSVEAWEKALNSVFQEVDMILHAGDVLYHGARNPLPAGYGTVQLAETLNACPIPLVIAQGNCDSDVDQMVIDIPMQAPFALVEAPWGRILLTHGHRYAPDEALILAEKYRVRLWVSGHTHVPVLEKTNNTIFFNPGSPSLPKGDDPRPTVGLITEGMVKLIALDSGATLMELKL